MASLSPKYWEKPLPPDWLRVVGSSATATPFSPAAARVSTFPFTLAESAPPRGIGVEMHHDEHAALLRWLAPAPGQQMRVVERLDQRRRGRAAGWFSSADRIQTGNERGQAFGPIERSLLDFVFL